MKGLDNWVIKGQGPSPGVRDSGPRQTRIEDLGKVVSLRRVKLIATLIDEQGMSDDTTLEYLKELNGMFIGYETLSATRIGRSVAALCEHSQDRRVREFCQRLVARWRSTATRGLRRRRRIAQKRTWDSVRIDHMKEMQQRRQRTQPGHGGAAAAAVAAAAAARCSAGAAGGEGSPGDAPQEGARRTWLHPPPRAAGAEDGGGETVLESDDEGGGEGHGE